MKAVNLLELDGGHLSAGGLKDFVVLVLVLKTGIVSLVVFVVGDS